MTDKSSISHNIMSEPENNREQKAFISVVTPAFNEADNLSTLYQELRSVLDNICQDWEWIVLDDHSTDETFAVLVQLSEQDSRVHGFRFSRNFGSHMAIWCGLNHARGDCAVVMAADTQDPRETISALSKEWRKGAQVVWAVSNRAEDEKVTNRIVARLYYFIMRHIVGIREMPATGSDFFLVDRLVLEALNQFKDSNVSILALITWMGFRQVSIVYEKRSRIHGRSGWSWGKKLKLLLDSIMAFSYLPIRLMSYTGLATAMLGFIYAVVIIINAILGRPIEGWASLMVVILIFGGIQMLFFGVLGEYIWRTLSEARQRPRYIIEAQIGGRNKGNTSAD